ncbi:MAG TPA: FHA domain-containing protein [Vicinamibacteria bacterium]|nr:FHA domain-containing protein [Vicinamibacteria bacterium]
MPFTCPSCDYPLHQEELPRLDAAKVLCPQCEEPLTLPDMTIPLSIVATPAEASPKLDPDKAYALVVLSGKGAGQMIALDKGYVTIGRSGCDILLDDAEISRRHACIEIDGDGATLEDLGSTNGTYVGDERIDRVSLPNRAQFRVGSHVMAFVVSDR